MNLALQVAAALCVLIGLIHSVLGERYILIRLFRRDNLPKLFGDTWFTVRTLRFAWHITTLAWWGFAALLWQLAGASPGQVAGAPPEQLAGASLDAGRVALTIGLTFAASALLALFASRGRHLAWLVFAAIAGICLYAALHGGVSGSGQG